jgi:hypothetical protein
MGEAVKPPFDDVVRMKPGSYFGWLAAPGPSGLTKDVTTRAAG